MLFTASTTAPYLPVARVTALWISHNSDSGVFRHVNAGVRLCVRVHTLHALCVWQNERAWLVMSSVMFWYVMLWYVIHIRGERFLGASKVNKLCLQKGHGCVDWGGNVYFYYALWNIHTHTLIHLRIWSCFEVWLTLSLTCFCLLSPPDHMYIEEYIEEDEEPPLLLSSRPSHGKYACLSSDRVPCTTQFKRLSALNYTANLLWLMSLCVCFCMCVCVFVCIFQVLGCGGTAAVQCRWGEGCVCLRCPAGQEPSKVRW